MIADSKKKQFQCVIVDKRDRFSRNSYQDAIHKHKLLDNGVELLSVKEEMLNGERTPEKVILKSVIVGINEYYSLNLAREKKKGMNNNAQHCIHNGGIPPLGFDIDENQKYILNIHEAEIVRKIFDYYLKNYSYIKIAELLNAEGYKNKRGRPFVKNSIRTLLMNEKYIGTFYFGVRNKKGKLNPDPIKIENALPQIISHEKFYAIQQKISSKSRRTISSNTKYLLTGNTICGECGGSFHGGGTSHGRNKIYYIYSYINKKKELCDNTNYRK